VIPTEKKKKKVGRKLGETKPKGHTGVHGVVQKRFEVGIGERVVLGLGGNKKKRGQKPCQTLLLIKTSPNKDDGSARTLIGGIQGLGKDGGGNENAWKKSKGKPIDP